MKRLIITAIVSLLLGLFGGLAIGRRLSPTPDQVANFLTGLSMGEFTEFAKQMNTRFGFQVFPQRIAPVGSGEATK